MKLSVRTQAVVVAAATLALTSACSSSGSDGGGDKGKSGSYRVLAIMALSGPLATLSGAERNALEASADKLNATGGILGRKIKMDFKDDQGDPTKAVGFVQSALTGGAKPDLVIAGTTSNETSAIAPLLKKAKIVSISEAGAVDLINPNKYPYNFSSSATNNATSAALVSILKKDGAKKVGIESTSDALGTSLATIYKKDFAAAGFEVVADSFDVTALDVTANVQRLKNAGVDHLVFSGFGAPAGHVLDARAKLKWTVPTLGDAAVGATPIKTLVPAAELNGVTYLANAPTVFSASVNPVVTGLVTAIKAKGGFKAPLQVYTYSYDELQVVKVAAEHAKSTDGPAVAKAMENLTQPNPSTFASFASITFSGTAADGHGVQAKPTDFVSVPAGSEIIDGLIHPTP
jgi:branched-chain amino acid transport system substrate-binding protein